MSLETLRQNTETLVEVISNYEYICEKRNQMIMAGKKKETEELNSRITMIKDYILKLIARSDTLVEEIRNE